MPFHLPWRFNKSVRSSDTPGYVSVGYFPNWSIYQKGYKPQHVPFAHLTHILYAFANIDPATGAVQLSDAWADQQIKYEGDTEASASHLCGNFYQFLQYKKTHRHLKLLLSIGGWSYSGNFRGMVQPAQRERFIESAVRLLADHGLDGLDSTCIYSHSRLGVSTDTRGGSGLCGAARGPASGA